MKKLMILTLVILIGCKTGNDVPTSVEKIYTGTQGLAMNFLEKNQPTNIYEDSEFQVDISIENKGTSDIEKGMVVINLENDYMKFDRWSSEFGDVDEMLPLDLKGRSYENPVGDSNIITAFLGALRFPESEKMSELHTSSMYFTACYDYKTQFFDTTCVDTDVYERKGAEKSCKISDKTFTDQGAPLAVTKIEPRMIASKDTGMIVPQYIVYFENKGDGEILSIDAVQKACSSSSLLNEDINVVKINAYLSGKKLDCEPKEKEIAIVKLKDKQGKIRCTLKEGLDTTQGTYMTPLQITAEYGYTFTISKEIEIKRMI